MGADPLRVLVLGGGSEIALRAVARLSSERDVRCVLAARDAESGCTVHVCTDEYDRGPIVLQQRVPVLPIDTPDSLAARVFAAECEAYPLAIEKRWRELQATTAR